MAQEHDRNERPGRIVSYVCASGRDAQAELEGLV